MHFLYRLSRCALCWERASSSLGCCEPCAKDLFRVQVGEGELALGPYDGALRKAVQALKYRHVTRLAHLFGRTIAKVVEEASWQVDVVTGVPLHLRRHLGRGYNQAALIAKVTAKGLGVPYRPVLKRKRATQKQFLLPQAERGKNVSDAFTSRPLKGERVLLVDDVVTSGATITECGLTLLQAGASRVYVAVVAKAEAPSAR